MNHNTFKSYSHFQPETIVIMLPELFSKLLFYFSLIIFYNFLLAIIFFQVLRFG